MKHEWTEKQNSLSTQVQNWILKLKAKERKVIESERERESRD